MICRVFSGVEHLSPSFIGVPTVWLENVDWKTARFFGEHSNCFQSVLASKSGKKSSFCTRTTTEGNTPRDGVFRTGALNFQQAMSLKKRDTLKFMWSKHFNFLNLLPRWLEKVKHILPNGGLMVICNLPWYEVKKHLELMQEHVTRS